MVPLTRLQQTDAAQLPLQKDITPNTNIPQCKIYINRINNISHSFQATIRNHHFITWKELRLSDPPCCNTSVKPHRSPGTPLSPSIPPFSSSLTTTPQDSSSNNVHPLPPRLHLRPSLLQLRLPSPSLPATAARTLAALHPFLPH
jgi:hypothetical protein